MADATTDPEDFVIGTGIQHSVRDFINVAAEELELKIQWSGKDQDMKGIGANGETIIEVDPRYFRPTEAENLLGDASKAREKLDGFKNYFP